MRGHHGRGNRLRTSRACRVVDETANPTPTSSSQAEVDCWAGSTAGKRLGLPTSLSEKSRARHALFDERITPEACPTTYWPPLLETSAHASSDFAYDCTVGDATCSTAGSLPGASGTRFFRHAPNWRRYGGAAADISSRRPGTAGTTTFRACSPLLLFNADCPWIIPRRRHRRNEKLDLAIISPSSETISRSPCSRAHVLEISCEPSPTKKPISLACFGVPVTKSWGRINLAWMAERVWHHLRARTIAAAYGIAAGRLRRHLVKARRVAFRIRARLHE